MERLASVNKFPVRFVADDEEFMLLGNVHHHPHFLRCQNRTCGVAGIGAHNGPGMLVDCRLNLCPVRIVVPFLRGGGDGVDLCATCVDHGIVIGIEGLGNQNFIAVVQNAVEDDLQGFTAAGGDEDFILLKVHIQGIIVPLDGLNQHWQARGGRILQDGLLEIPDCLKVLGGRFNVRLPNVQVIDLFAGSLCCHGVGMELSHRGQAAFFGLAGKFHTISSVRPHADQTGAFHSVLPTTYTIIYAPLDVKSGIYSAHSPRIFFENLCIFEDLHEIWQFHFRFSGKFAL